MINGAMINKTMFFLDNDNSEKETKDMNKTNIIKWFSILRKLWLCPNNRR